MGGVRYENLSRGICVKKVARVIRKDEGDELDTLFWLEKDPEEKLSAVQALREQHISYLNRHSLYRAGRSRFAGRRVYRVIDEEINT